MKDIVNNNKLIGKFMNVNIPFKTDSKKVITTLLKFHSSWDWLMPVVDKIINKTHEPKKGNYTYCDKIDNLIRVMPIICINSTYEKVVSFIKWYNKEYNK